LRANRIFTKYFSSRRLAEARKQNGDLAEVSAKTYTAKNKEIYRVKIDQ
jgi:hypothetical protein